MSDLLHAFPWLSRLAPLRPYRPWLEPALAALLLLVSIPSATGAALESFAGMADLVLAAVAIALVRIVPWVSLVLVGAAGVLYALAAPWLALGWLMVMTAVAIGLVAGLRRPVERWFALALAIAAGIGFGWHQGIGLVVPMPLMIGAWGIGTAIGEGLARIRAVHRTEELTERLDASELQLAVTAERERVAQEVHDVVAHSLAVILAQAEGARALSTKRPAAMTDALDRIAQTSRGALLDVRGIVDGLTGGAEPPQPTIDDLPELLSGVEQSGVAVRSTSAGEPRDLGAAQQTAVYRIVQEGATNAIRHRGSGSALDVVLDWRGPGLSLQIVSSGVGDAVPAPGVGRGIPGMTDRARIAGGWLAAGEDESGDHRITAFIPFRDADATPAPVPSAPAVSA